VAERVVEAVFSREERAICDPRKAAGAEHENGNIKAHKMLPLSLSSGGGGNRTRADPKP
jgi:hypothetical protein